MTTCPICARALAFHTDAACTAEQTKQAEVARVILRNTMAVPFREEITRMGERVMIAIALTSSQYDALKKFAEEE